MKTVYKYDLRVTDTQTLQLPAGAQILHVQEQLPGSIRPSLQLWVLVDTLAKLQVTRTILIVGTGNPMPEDEGLSFIDTVVTMGGALVWHVFEVAP